MILYIPIGTFMCGALDFGGVVGVVGENEAYSVLKCNTDVDLFVDWRNMTIGHLKYFKIDGNGHAKTCIDTSYTISGGPSCNNRYEKVRVRGFKELGWKATNNNDVWWEGVQIVEPAVSGAEALQIVGNGGPITIQNCNFLAGLTTMDGQYISLINNVFMGIKIQGVGWNVLTLIGDYIFANNDKTNINIASGTIIWGLNMHGCHIENRTPAGETGYVISGGGEIATHRITMDNCHMFSTDGGTVKLIGGLIPSGYKSVFIDVIGGVHGISFTSDTPDFLINTLDVNVGGQLLDYILRTGNNSYISESKMKLGRVEDCYKVVTIPSDTWVDLPVDIGYNDSPFMCLLMIKGGLDSPSATFILSKTGGWNQSVTALQSTAGIAAYDSAVITCQFASGKFQIKQNSTQPLTVDICAIRLIG